MSKSKSSRPIAVHLGPELIALIDAAAAKENMTRSCWLRDAAELKLDIVGRPPQKDLRK